MQNKHRFNPLILFSIVLLLAVGCFPATCDEIDCGNGECIEGDCICELGWWGYQCETWVENLIVGGYDLEDSCFSTSIGTYIAEIRPQSSGIDDYILLNPGNSGDAIPLELGGLESLYLKNEIVFNGDTISSLRLEYRGSDPEVKFVGKVIYRDGSLGDTCYFVMLKR